MYKVTYSDPLVGKFQSQKDHQRNNLTLPVFEVLLLDITKQKHNKFSSVSGHIMGQGNITTKLDANTASCCFSALHLSDCTQVCFGRVVCKFTRPLGSNV